MAAEILLQVYAVYMVGLVLVAAVIYLLVTRLRREEPDEAGPQSKFVVNELPSEIMRRKAEEEAVARDPLQEEIDELNVAIRKIRDERSRQRASVKAQGRSMTDIEAQKFKDLFALMGRMKRRVKEIEDRRSASETHTYDE
jgi:hypothetical protein